MATKPAPTLTEAKAPDPTPAVAIPTVDIEALRAAHIASVEEQMEAFRPAYEAYMQLETYRLTLTGEGSRPSAARRTASTPAAAGSRARRATGGSGVNRALQFLQGLEQKPGATVSELAKIMTEMSPDQNPVANNYLYRVRDTLKDQGLIVDKDGGGFLITDAGKASIVEQTAEATAA